MVDFEAIQYFFMKISLFSFTSSLMVKLWPLQHSQGFFTFSRTLQHTRTAAFGNLSTSTGTLLANISSLTASTVTFMASTGSLQALSFLYNSPQSLYWHPTTSTRTLMASASILYIYELMVCIRPFDIYKHYLTSHVFNTLSRVLQHSHSLYWCSFDL
jgi:hypothetical protein